MKDKILLVDDDPLVLECLERMLAKHFTLDAAAGPREALSAISARGPYAVVVSDMGMPGLDGIQLLTRMKEIAPHTVGIILSGNADDVQLLAGDSKVIFKTLEKPCPFDKLVDTIREAIAYHCEIQKA